MSTDERDLSLWLSWKRVNEVTRGRILADILEHTVLTDAEFTVLAHLDDAGGTLRQNALATAAGWDRTRLSHLLTRMEQRGYVARERLRNGAEVSALDAGRAAFAATHEPLVQAVRRHFTSRLTPEQREMIQGISVALGGEA